MGGIDNGTGVSLLSVAPPALPTSMVERHEHRSVAHAFEQPHPTLEISVVGSGSEVLLVWSWILQTAPQFSNKVLHVRLR